MTENAAPMPAPVRHTKGGRTGAGQDNRYRRPFCSAACFIVPGFKPHGMDQQGCVLVHLWLHLFHAK
jgi:hypothetical protein